MYSKKKALESKKGVLFSPKSTGAYGCGSILYGHMIRVRVPAGHRTLGSPAPVRTSTRTRALAGVSFLRARVHPHTGAGGTRTRRLPWSFFLQMQHRGAMVEPALVSQSPVQPGHRCKSVSDTPRVGFPDWQKNKRQKPFFFQFWQLIHPVSWGTGNKRGVSYVELGSRREVYLEIFSVIFRKKKYTNIAGTVIFQPATRRAV